MDDVLNIPTNVRTGSTDDMSLLGKLITHHDWDLVQRLWMVFNVYVLIEVSSQRHAQ